MSTNKILSSTAATERLSIVAGHVARSGLEHPVPLLASLKMAQPEVAVAILSGLARNWPRDVKPSLTAELEASLGELFADLPAAGKSQLVTLATRWGSEGLGKHVATLTTSFLKEAANTEATDQARLKAAKEYADLLRADGAAAKLIDLVTPQTSPEIAQGLIEALETCETSEVGQALADRRRRVHARGPSRRAPSVASAERLDGPAPRSNRERQRPACRSLARSETGSG